MSDWFHELPVPWMALLVFGFTYMLALAIHAGVAALARSGHAKSFKAVSPGMLSPLGVIFGLFVAFTAAQVWSDNDRAGAAFTKKPSITWVRKKSDLALNGFINRCNIVNCHRAVTRYTSRRS